MSLDINIDDLSIDEKKEILSVDNLTLMSIEEGYQEWQAVCPLCR